MRSSRSRLPALATQRFLGGPLGRHPALEFLSPMNGLEPNVALSNDGFGRFFAFARTTVGKAFSPRATERTRYLTPSMMCPSPGSGTFSTHANSCLPSGRQSFTHIATSHRYPAQQQRIRRLTGGDRRTTAVRNRKRCPYPSQKYGMAHKAMRRRLAPVVAPGRGVCVLPADFRSTRSGTSST